MATTPQDLNNTVAPVTATSPYGTGKNATQPTTQDGTPITALWFNQFMNGTAVSLLRAAGIIPNSVVDNADISQISQAIQSAIAKGNLVNDISTQENIIVLSSFRDAANGYNLTHPIAVLQDKQQFRFVATFTNTSTSVTLKGSQNLQAKQIVNLKAGDISAGTLYIATYSGNDTTGTFEIRPEVFAAIQDNILDNGDFIIAQRGTNFTAATTFTNADGNYTLDRFKVIDSRAGSDVVDISQTKLASELPAEARAAITLTHQRQNEQAGLVQYIDYDTTRTLLNKDLSLSFEIYNSDSVTRNFRAAILSWQGTADDMPNDPVATWQTAGNLGFATGFTIENTTTALVANATAWNRFTINGVNLDTASTNNLAIVIWTDESIANGDEWRATKIKLEQSAVATAWKAKAIADEENNCYKYASASFSDGVISTANSLNFSSKANSAFLLTNPTIKFQCKMRVPPVVVAYSPVSQAKNKMARHDLSSSYITDDTVIYIVVGNNSAEISGNGTLPLNNYFYRVHYFASSDL